MQLLSGSLRHAQAALVPALRRLGIGAHVCRDIDDDLHPLQRGAVDALDFDDVRLHCSFSRVKFNERDSTLTGSSDTLPECAGRGR
jgi:hypothetical protein